jgi:hypothetical protein
LVAGNITNSVFAASVEPTNTAFGSPDELLFPHGRITAKIEGKIDNSTATPDMPNRAFYAKSVTLAQGPVVPPAVPEEPFPNPGGPPTGDRVVKGLQPTTPRTRTSK